jgi:ubiquinone/menaquinone biosynthesis C-methylase UbiE
MSERVKPEDFADWNERMARLFDVDHFHAHSSPLVRFIIGRRIAAFLDYLQPTTADRILEIGCGSGHLLAHVRVGKRFGIDLSPTLIERARNRLGPEVDLRVGNAENLPYSDSEFTKTYCSEVLEHVLHPEQVLAEMARVTAPGGVAVITIPHENTINLAKKILMRLGLFDVLLGRKSPGTYNMTEHMEDEWHLREFTLSMLKGYLPPTLRCLRVRAVPLPGLAVHYVMACEVVKHG